jgi:hypothetical protein
MLVMDYSLIGHFIGMIAIGLPSSICIGSNNNDFGISNLPIDKLTSIYL